MKITIYVEDLLDEYKSGLSLDKISINHKYINVDSIKTAINAYINKKHLNSIREERYKNISGDEIDKLIQEGCSYDDIIRLYDFKTKTQVVNKLNEFYASKGLPTINPIYNKKDLPIEEIVEAYKQGQSMTDIAAKYNVAYSVIFDRIQHTSPNDIRRRNADVLQPYEEEIISKYETGSTAKKLSNEYHVSIQKMEKFLDAFYQNSYVYPFRPTVLTEAKFRGWLKTINSLDKEKSELLSSSNLEETKKLILQNAKEANVIIPKAIIEKYFGKEISISAIEQFLKNKLLSQNIENNKKQDYFKYFEISNSLKEHGFNLMYIATALLYDLPNISDTKIEEILEAVNNNIEICDAIEIINKDELTEEYFTKLKENELARNVKLAIVNYEFRKLKFEGKNLPEEKYKLYKELSRHTLFARDFNTVDSINIIPYPQNGNNEEEPSL